MRGNKMTWEYILLGAILIIAIYAVYKVEFDNIQADQVFNERLNHVENVSSSNAELVLKAKESLLKIDSLIDNQNKVNESIDKLAQVITKNLEGVHLDVDKLELAMAQRADKIELTIPTKPLMVELIGQPYKTKSITHTRTRKEKGVLIQESVRKSGPLSKRKSLPGLKESKRSMKAMDL